MADSKDFGSLSITILADNDYYSETAFSRYEMSRGRFANFGVPLQEAHKTGLGSSAALVTALVSALVIHRTMQPEDLGLGRDKLHNLAQAAHCAAQGKVGPGFDDASATTAPVFTGGSRPRFWRQSENPDLTDLKSDCLRLWRILTRNIPGTRNVWILG